MPILHSPGVMTPGQFGPIEHRLAALDDRVHADHIEHRHAFGDGDDGFDAGIDRFENGVGGEGGGTKIIVASAPVFSTASIDRVEHRQAFDRFAAFAGRHAADHLRAVFFAALGVELAHLAGDALADDAGDLVDQNAHDVES